MKRFFAVIPMSLAAIFFCGQDAVNAQDSPSALTGRVSSQEEGPMEGVLVSAKRTGSTVTITVVSNAQGQYSFPRNRLPPGPYSLRIRAIGYELDSSGTVEVTAEKATQLDLKLRKVQDVSSQLSNGEWLASMPGTDEQRQVFLNCVTCHTVERIVRSRHNAGEFAEVIQRMADYSQGATQARPQRRLGAGEPLRPAQQEQVARNARYLSTVNLSSVSRWEYPLKTLSRPKDKGTRVLITEYDLPRPETQPHDAAVDSTGNIWYSDFTSPYLGMLDPKTAKAVEYPLPITKPGAPTGSLDIGFDKEGNVWMGTMYQGSLAKFDRKTQKFQTWGSPKFKERDEARIAMVMPAHLDLDGKVWIGGDNEYQVDLRSGEWHTVDYMKDIPKDSPAAARQHGSYGVAADSQNNFYGMELGSDYVNKVDGKTMKVTFYRTPTPNSGPRRGHMDSQDRLWFAEFRGNRIGMLDPKTERIQEWEIPTPWTNPYDAVLDKEGNAWTGGMSNDHVVRVNSKTGEVTEYLLPRSTNIRRVNVDNATNPPTFWVGNNHGASIIRLEPLE
ncbi:MAG: carboxypeptidase regulatory-like domain-containing protein [Acidobacteria bacterium]|nr:carboxypeptidase regulatory-like domain-containing protein [Acidobacteriota bacterium]